VRVAISPIRYWLPATQIAADSALDYAVLAVWIDPKYRWRAPRVPRRARKGPVYGEKIYALGCPQGRCSYPAIPGEWNTSEAGLVEVKGMLLEGGLSGGPITDEDGALVAVATEVALPDGYGVDWSYIRGILQRAGVPTSLPMLLGVRRQSARMKGYISPWPQPGRDSDGASIAPGMRLELGVQWGELSEVVIGLDRVAYNSFSHWYDKPDTYVTNYFTIGYRAIGRNSFFSVSREGRDYASGGLDLLIPLREASVVTYVHTDSIDTRHGEEALVRGATRVTTDIGWVLRFDYLVPVSERFALVIAASGYAESVEDRALSSYAGTFQLQIGGVYQWKF
jgi:hypothetical protein